MLQLSRKKIFSKNAVLFCVSWSYLQPHRYCVYYDTFFFCLLFIMLVERVGLKAHALRCYSIALNNLGGYRWCYVSDHLLFSLARQAFTLRFLADSLVFFFHLLNNLVIQSVPSHLGYSLPLYSRLTAFSGPDTNAYLLPMDSQTLQKTMGFTSRTLRKSIVTYFLHMINLCLVPFYNSIRFQCK